MLARLRANQPDFPLPRVTHAIRGGVSMFWELSGHRIMVQIESSNPRRVYYQYAAPAAQTCSGREAVASTLRRLLAIHRSR